jgi:hypothetical protein
MIHECDGLHPGLAALQIVGTPVGRATLLQGNYGDEACGPSNRISRSSATGSAAIRIDGHQRSRTEAI